MTQEDLRSRTSLHFPVRRRRKRNGGKKRRGKHSDEEGIKV